MAISRSDPFTSFAAGGKLCARSGEARSLVCTSPDGTKTYTAVGGELVPLEHPVVLEADQMITRQGTIVRVRRGTALVAEWTLQVIGRCRRAGFVVTTTADEAALGHPLWGLHRWSRPGLLPRGRVGRIRGPAVDGDTVMLYVRGSATTYRGSAPPAGSVSIDDGAHRATIFPSAWGDEPDQRHRGMRRREHRGCG